MATKMSEDVSVVVVGAGIAGLSAAAKLIDGGVIHVTVLEAQGRIGGRIHTLALEDDSVLDLGAQWIHGQKGNCVYKLAKSHSLFSESLEVGAYGKDRRLELEAFIFLTSKGERVPNETLNTMIPKLMFISNEAPKWYIAEADGKEGKSSDEYSSDDSFESSDEEVDESWFNVRELFPVGQIPNSFGEFFDRCCQQLFRYSDSRSFVLKMAFAQWQKQFFILDNACTSLNDISLQGIVKYHHCPGDDYIEFERGFKSLLDIIIKDIPAESILLSKPVKTVIWQSSRIESTDEDLSDNKDSPECMMKVSTDAKDSLENSNGLSEPHDGTTANRRTYVQCEDGSEFEADYVIMTPSLGYLKEHADTLFSPCLPEAKRNALRTVEFGTMNKIFLEWEEPFWEEGCTGFQFLWLEDSPVTITSDRCEHKTTAGFPWYQNLQGFESVINQQNMLSTLLGGDSATLLETVPDEEVLDVCLEILRFFTKRDIPRPIRIFRSSWYSNPYIRGSYARLGSNTPLEDHEILMEPLPDYKTPVLQFAGEAYSRHHFTTTHGAMETGRLAADRILKHVQNKKVV